MLSAAAPIFWIMLQIREENMMKRIIEKHYFKWIIFILIIIVSAFILGGGYWLYQQSIESAVYTTTVSFMEQIADHDHLNIINQMNNKWEYLNSVLKRISNTRDPKLKDVIYVLNVESQATTFERLYLITDDEKIYSNSYLENDLKNMPWASNFQNTEGNFVTKYGENGREH